MVGGPWRRRRAGEDLLGKAAEAVAALSVFNGMIIDGLEIAGLVAFQLPEPNTSCRRF